LINESDQKHPRANHQTLTLSLNKQSYFEHLMVKGENWIEQKGIESLKAIPLPSQRMNLAPPAKLSTKIEINFTRLVRVTNAPLRGK